MRSSVEEIFHEVADLSRETRVRYFEEHRIDAQIRNEVEALLAFDCGSTGFLKKDVGEVAQSALERLGTPGSVATPDAPTPTPRDPAPDNECGPYRLLRRLGLGGMGEVWLAERIDGMMNRPVAVKLPFNVHGHHLIERAHREREILAGLSHPGIAALYDAGLTNAGQPYLALEYIEGVTITDYCDQNRLTVRERLNPFLDILSAVQYAHSRLVIHRDLKPSNILVTAEGEVKLLDFGIAKLMHEGEASETELTSVAGRPFTPDYASPEQAAGRDITTASDVYSLGVVLYELVCGERAYQVTRSSWTPVEQVIQNASVRAPSQAVGREDTAAQRSTTPGKLAAILRGDLDTIVLKALNKDSERRYQTVEAFRADIERYLSGRAVLARPDSQWYRTRKFLRRHRGAVASAAAVFVALAAGLGVALWQANVARREARTSTAVQAFIQDIFRANSQNQPDPLKAQQTTARELLNLGAQKIEVDLNDAPEAKGKMLSILADLYSDLGLYDQQVSLLRRHVQLLRNQPGRHGIALAMALTELGQSMHASRSVNEREKVLLEAKSILDQEQDYSSGARAALSMALCEHYQSSDLNQAQEFGRQAVELYRAAGPSSDLAEALFVQANVYKFQRDMESTARVAAEAIAIGRQFGGERFSSLPRFYTVHGEALLSLMRFGEAEDRFRLAQKASLALNGEDHADTIETGSQLGSFLTSISRNQEGLPYLEKALESTLRTRGASDPFYTPKALFLYGQALYNNGRLEEAMARISAAVDNRRMNRPGTLFLGQMLEQQAGVMTELGQYDQAAAALDEALEIRKRGGVKVEVPWARPRIRLALVTGHVGEAAALAQQYCADIAPAKLSYQYLQRVHTQAEISRAQGNLNQAIHLAARLTSEIAASPNRSYLAVWERRSVLTGGQALLESHQPLRALPLLERSVELSRQVFDPKGPEIAVAQIALANCYLDLARAKEARALAAQAKEILGSHPRLGAHLLVPLQRLTARMS